MNLQELYKEETNNETDCNSYYGTTGSYTDDYVEWLEKQLILSGVVQPLKNKNL